MMTKLLDQVVEAACHLQVDAQDETLPAKLSPEELAAMAASKAAASRGDFATDEEVEAVWAKHLPAPRSGRPASR